MLIDQDCVTKQREEESNYIWMEVTAMLHMCGWDLMMLYANEILYKVNRKFTYRSSYPALSFIEATIVGGM